MPAIVDRGDIVVAVSTHGASPVLAQRVRAAIESVLPPGLGRLAQFAQRFRAAIGVPNPGQGRTEVESMATISQAGASTG